MRPLKASIKIEGVIIIFQKDTHLPLMIKWPLKSLKVTKSLQGHPVSVSICANEQHVQETSTDFESGGWRRPWTSTAIFTLCSPVKLLLSSY